MRSLGIWFVVGLTAASQPFASPQVAATIEDAAVERTAEGAAVVRWRSTPRDAPIDVAIMVPGEQPRLISDDDRDGQHELTAADAARRPLVRLTASAGKTLTTAERLLPLQGGRNFRDLGGYRTQDGRRVKWGKVYRSGTMAGLTDADYAFLSTLGIKVICDFRANDEREREPTVWRTSGTKIDYRTRNYVADADRKTLLGDDGAPTPEKMRAAMLSFYRVLPYQHADSYRTLFKALAGGEIPLTFNCSAGKDRTGVAAALLLTMLGVSRDTVVEDFALSERLVNYEAQYARQERTQAGAQQGAMDAFAKLPAAVRAPLLRSDPDYVREALSAIEQREGSIDAYFERVLLISAPERARIRELLLEKQE